MVPKVIHYCWFGRNEKPRLVRRCIESWHKVMPDYKIVEWNEDNFNVFVNSYTTYCYDRAAWAHLSDYARLAIVYQHGGIYLDTDVEAVRPFDDLLETAFIGFEENSYVNSGQGFGAPAGSSVVLAMMQPYFHWRPPFQNCPSLNTIALKQFGFMPDGITQRLKGITVYSSDYFCPLDDKTGVLTVTKNTHSIHWYGKSWMSARSILRNRVSRRLHRMFGVSSFRKER